MPNITETTVIQLQAVETATNNVLMARTIPGLVNATLTSIFYEAYFLVPNADTTINLPVTPSQVIYIKNLTAAAGVGDLLVKWTPNGGAEATIITLKPQGVILLYEGAAGGGISTLKLNGTPANTAAEIFIAG